MHKVHIAAHTQMDLGYFVAPLKCTYGLCKNVASLLECGSVKNTPNQVGHKLINVLVMLKTLLQYCSNNFISCLGAILFVAAGICCVKCILWACKMSEIERKRKREKKKERVKC